MATKLDTVEITFTEGVEVKDHNGEIEFKARRGESGKLPKASAERWIRRGKAVEGKVKLDPELEADDETGEPESGETEGE